MEVSGTWYNTVEGMWTSLGTLEGFHKLLRARSEAHARNEELDEFVVMGGRFWLDKFGQLFHAAGTDPTVVLPDAARVLPFSIYRSAFMQRLEQLGKSRFEFGWCVGGGRLFPSAEVSCAICGQRWTAENCHDCTRGEIEYSEVSLTGCAGQSLTVAARSLTPDPLAVRHVHTDMVRNDRFKEPSSGDRVKRDGWKYTSALGGDDYVVQPGDEVLLSRTLLYHRVCRLNALAVEERAASKVMFQAAGFESFKLRQVKNEYGSESYRGPWFEVTTDVGMIRVGWRKRVIEIDWSSIGQDLLYLFEDVRHTKGNHLIHAYGYAPAIDYLTRLRKALQEKKGAVGFVQ